MTTARFTRSLRPAALALLLAAAGPLSAQETDPRWLPWVGCWEPVAEEATGDLLCVRPAGRGVEVTETANGAVVSTQTLVADGRAYAITAEGCMGSRSAEFSTDGKRLFTLTEQACDGDIARTSTGLIAMVSPSEWIDVQAAREEGEALGWARRYRPARDEAMSFGDQGTMARRARTAAAAQVDVDDVIEATRSVDPEAVRTWIAELQDPFDLDRRRLLRLADAGVPADVIDVMVAVSYPDRFAVDRDGDIDELALRDAPRDRRGPYGRRRGGFFGSVYDPYYDYGYGRGYGGGWYGPGVVVVMPRGEDPEPNARVVKGRGYTRGNGGSAPAASQGTQPQSGEKPAPKPTPEPEREPEPEPRRAVPRGG